MSDWELIPCLVTLRDEFNRLSPKRDKGADGSIGDSAHTSTSDHTPDEDSTALRNKDADKRNEVHACDIDSSGKWPGEGTQKQRFHRINMRILAREKEKWNSATDKCRLNYLIWDGMVYDKDRDFVPYKHTGPDPHTNHAHYSARYETSCENDTRPWGVFPEALQAVEEGNMAIGDDQIKLTAGAAKELGGNYTEGSTVSGETAFNLLFIYACRADDKAGEAVELGKQNAVELAAIRKLLESPEEAKG